jgi:hypothetical protein
VERIARIEEIKVIYSIYPKPVKENDFLEIRGIHNRTVLNCVLRK